MSGVEFREGTHGGGGVKSRLPYKPYTCQGSGVPYSCFALYSIGTVLDHQSPRIGEGGREWNGRRLRVLDIIIVVSSYSEREFWFVDTTVKYRGTLKLSSPEFSVAVAPGSEIVLPYLYITRYVLSIILLSKSVFCCLSIFKV